MVKSRDKECPPSRQKRRQGARLCNLVLTAHPCHPLYLAICAALFPRCLLKESEPPSHTSAPCAAPSRPSAAIRNASIGPYSITETFQSRHITCHSGRDSWETRKRQKVGQLTDVSICRRRIYMSDNHAFCTMPTRIFLLEKSQTLCLFAFFSLSLLSVLRGKQRQTFHSGSECD